MNFIITTINKPTESTICLNNLLDKKKGKIWVVGDKKGLSLASKNISGKALLILKEQVAQ